MPSLTHAKPHRQHAAKPHPLVNAKALATISNRPTTPSSINPFVVFLGASPGGSPPACEVREPYELPTAGVAHPKLYVCDGAHYWDRVRALGSMVVQAHAPKISDPHAHALIGQLNLGTGQFGKVSDAPFEPEYCRWVPEVMLDYLRPSFT